MADILFLAATLLLVLTAAGLFVLWRRGSDADRLLAIQLVGSGCIAVLLLLGVAMEEVSGLDVALLLALLAALAACGYRAAIGSVRGPRA